MQTQKLTEREIIKSKQYAEIMVAPPLPLPHATYTHRIRECNMVGYRFLSDKYT